MFIMSVQDIKILSWNCRGINSDIIKRLIRDTSTKEKANLVCIQETKCSNWPVNGMQLLGNGVNEACIIQQSDGASGGLASSWNGDLFQCIGSAQSKHWIWIQLKTLDNKERINVINVYSPLTLTAKKLLWMELSQILEIVKNEHLCLVGDFNSIRDNKERSRCSYSRNDIQGFNRFIKNSNLLDLDMEDGSFTWFGPQGKCSKLDRFLINNIWAESGQWSVKALCRLTSDHKPIILSSDKASWGPKPFKSFNWWFQEASFTKELDKFWQDLSPFKSEKNIQEILKEAKIMSKSWSSNKQNSLSERIKFLKSYLDDLDANNIWGTERDDVRSELMSCLEKQESMMKQKSRFKWILEGDINTRFYNQFIQKRRYRNKISKIWWKGRCCSKPGSVKKIFFLYFKEIYNKSQCNIFSLGSLLNTQISAEENKDLEKKFTILEVEAALHSLGADKAQVLMDLTICSLKSFGHISRIR